MFRFADGSRFDFPTEETLDPVEMRIEQANHEADVEHGEKRTDADQFPVPVAEEDEAADDADDDHRSVAGNLHLAELNIKSLRYGQKEPFVSQEQHIAMHLQGNTECHDRTTQTKFHESNAVTENRAVELHGNGHPHRQVRVKSEEQTDHKLQQLQRLIVLLQQNNLCEDQQHLNADDVFAHRERRSRNKTPDVRRTGNWRRTEIGADGKRRAKGDEEQRNEKNDVTTY